MMKKEEESEHKSSLEALQKEILLVSKRNQDHLDQLRRYTDELERKKAETARIKEKYKIYVRVPRADINFECRHEQQGEDLIRGVFIITQTPSVLLNGGQALITFEEERVASRIQKIPNFSVSCGSETLNVKPTKINIPSVKFEVHLDISKKQLQLSNLFSSMAEERIKDRLELSFSKPSRGGGEVERVEYDRNNKTALITFLQPGVALSLAQAGMFQVDLEVETMVDVRPVFNHRLHLFETFCASPKTTVLLSGMKDLIDEKHQQECLEVYFQKPSHGGGEIEHIRYISKKKPLRAFFSCDNVTVVEDTSGVQL